MKRKDKREFRNVKEREPSPDKVAFGVDDLYKYFEEYREFEALLYGADRFYRDHIMHVFRVWLIGNWLIEKFDSKIFWDFKDIYKKNSYNLKIKLSINSDTPNFLYKNIIQIKTIPTVKINTTAHHGNTAVSLFSYGRIISYMGSKK